MAPSQEACVYPVGMQVARRKRPAAPKQTKHNVGGGDMVVCTWQERQRLNKENRMSLWAGLLGLEHDGE